MINFLLRAGLLMVLASCSHSPIKIEKQSTLSPPFLHPTEFRPMTNGEVEGMLAKKITLPKKVTLGILLRTNHFKLAQTYRAKTVLDLKELHLKFLEKLSGRSKIHKVIPVAPNLAPFPARFDLFREIGARLGVDLLMVSSFHLGHIIHEDQLESIIDLQSFTIHVATGKLLAQNNATQQLLFQGKITSLPPPPGVLLKAYQTIYQSLDKWVEQFTHN